MNWNRYLMGFAQHAAKKSKDSTQVGAVLVDKHNTVLLTAYNGPPRGVEDNESRRERPEKYLYASHSEANLIAFAARHGIKTEGCYVYVTHHPCSSCAKALIQAGIRGVYVGPGLTSMPHNEFRAASVMFKEAMVTVCAVHDDGSTVPC